MGTALRGADNWEGAMGIWTMLGLFWLISFGVLVHSFEHSVPDPYDEDAK